MISQCSGLQPSWRPDLKQNWIGQQLLGRLLQICNQICPVLWLLQTSKDHFGTCQGKWVSPALWWQQSQMITNLWSSISRSQDSSDGKFESSTGLHGSTYRSLWIQASRQDWSMQYEHTRNVLLGIQQVVIKSCFLPMNCLFLVCLWIWEAFHLSRLQKTRL